MEITKKPTEISSTKMFGGYNRRFKHLHLIATQLSQSFFLLLLILLLTNSLFNEKGDRLLLYSQMFDTDDIVFAVCSNLIHRRHKVLYWLSGLSCTDENFIIKSGAQRAASAEGIALIAPDTSPRGLNVPVEADNWDFGIGAGFYLNATQEKWKNWRLYDYVVKELPQLLSENFTQHDTSRTSISGHSMGGHGALTIYLKNLDK